MKFLLAGLAILAILTACSGPGSVVEPNPDSQPGSTVETDAGTDGNPY